MGIPENGMLPPPPTPEEELKFLRMRAADLMEIGDVNLWDTDEDIERRLNKLRIYGAWPVPHDASIEVKRAWLTGVYAGVKEMVRMRRSGGIA